jgi:hypothetical protein
MTHLLLSTYATLLHLEFRIFSILKYATLQYSTARKHYSRKHPQLWTDFLEGKRFGGI